MANYNFTLSAVFVVLLSGCGSSPTSPISTASAQLPPIQCNRASIFPDPENASLPDARILPGAKTIPATFQLFGPTQLFRRYDSMWRTPSNAFTSSTKFLRFDLNYPNIASAKWVVAWTANNPTAAIRLVAWDAEANHAGHVNETVLFTLCSSGRDSPTASLIDVTQAMNALRQDGRVRIIGVEVIDDGGDEWTLFEARLELNFEL